MSASLMNQLDCNERWRKEKERRKVEARKGSKEVNVMILSDLNSQSYGFQMRLFINTVNWVHDYTNNETKTYSISIFIK
jgi:hypothetical protein